MNRPGTYLAANSLVHRLDPRVKITAAAVFSIIVLQVQLPGLAAAAAVILNAAGAARLPLGSWLKTLRPVWPFFLFLFLIYLFFTPGISPPLLQVGIITISYEGLQTGLVQIGKFMLLVLAAALLTSTTSTAELTQGLARLLRPFSSRNMHADDLAMMVTLAVRFLPLLMEEGLRLQEAGMARGLTYSSLSLGKKIRVYGYLAAPLLTNIFRRGDNLADSMLARGYRGGPRTYLQELALNRADYFCLILLAASLAAYFWFRI